MEHKERDNVIRKKILNEILDIESLESFRSHFLITILKRRKKFHGKPYAALETLRRISMNRSVLKMCG